MTLLFDTNVFVWWMRGEQRISPRLRNTIEQNRGKTYVSAISAYEMSQKFRLGKWPEVAPFMEGFEELAAAANLSILNVTPRHALRAGLLPGDERQGVAGVGGGAGLGVMRSEREGPTAVPLPRPGASRDATRLFSPLRRRKRILGLGEAKP